MLLISTPAPLTFNTFPPALAAVPRSTVPPVMLMAASLKPVDSWIVSLRSVRLPPVTRMVGASPVVTKVTLETTTLPDWTVKAGPAGSTVVGSWLPTVPLITNVIPAGTFTVSPEYVPGARFNCKVTAVVCGGRAPIAFTTSATLLVFAWTVTAPPPERAAWRLVEVTALTVCSTVPWLPTKSPVGV